MEKKFLIQVRGGCIAISLAKNFPNAKVTALDVSCDPLEVAIDNAKLNNVEVNFINADIFEYQSVKKYDVIVSNPPYVLESEKIIIFFKTFGNFWHIFKISS